MSSDPDYSPTTLRPSTGEETESETFEGRQEQAKEKAGEARDRAMEKASETRERAMEQADRGRERAAEGTESTAEKIRERTEGRGGMQEKVGTSVAGGMERTAGYLREHRTEDMWNDLEQYAREHPAQALGGAIAAGFLLGRILR